MDRSATLWLALALGTVLTGTTFGQQAPPPGALDNRLDVLLREWSNRTREVRSLYAEFSRETYDPQWKTKDTADGSARYLEPNRARLDIVGGENPESYVLTGQGEIWEFKPTLKQVKIFELPPEMARRESFQEDGPLPFLFASDPERAKARYQFEIIEENDKTVRVRIVPKLREDQANFATAELWLSKDRFLPERLQFVEPNQTRVTFQFRGIWKNVDVNPDDFKPKMVEGWRVIRQKVGEQPPAPGQQPRSTPP